MSQRSRLTRRDESSALVAHNLGNAADIRGDDRTAASERLQDNVGAAFHVTWQGDQIGCRHPDGNLVEITTGQHVDIVGSVVGLNGALDERPVRPLADQVNMQIRSLAMQRRRRFDEFTKPLLHVHPPNINDDLHGRVDVQLLPRLKAIPDVEDRSVAAIDNGAGLLRRGAHGY